MVDKFFPVRQFGILCGNNDPLLLLSGPPSSGKTSLLFQFAINSVTESNGGNVVFISTRRKLDIKPPLLVQGIDPSSDIFQRIHMKYIDDEEGLKKYFAAFHMYDDPAPVSAIIDDFAHFFDEGNCQKRYNNIRGRDLAMVRVLALCRNAIMYANEKGPCQLLLSDTHLGDSPRLLYIYKRWVSSIYTIKSKLATLLVDRFLLLTVVYCLLEFAFCWPLIKLYLILDMEGDGFGSYLIRSSNNLGVAKTAKYSIALQYLVLESITEDEEQSGD